MYNEIKQIEEKFKEEKELNLTFLIAETKENIENEKQWEKENPQLDERRQEIIYGISEEILQKIYKHYDDVYSSRNKLFDGLSKIPASQDAYFYTGFCNIEKFQTLIKLEQFKTVWITNDDEMEQAKLNTKYSIEYYKMTEEKKE